MAKKRILNLTASPHLFSKSLAAAGTDLIRLNPGENVVDGDWWANLVKTDAIIRHYLETGEFEELGDA